MHSNWANDEFRKLVLNSLCWIAKVNIPADGINSPTPTQSELEAHCRRSQNNKVSRQSPPWEGWHRRYEDTAYRISCGGAGVSCGAPT